MAVPQLRKPISLILIFALTTTLSLLYILCLAASKNKYILVFQVTFFLIPALVVMKTGGIENATNKAHLLKNALVTILISLVVTVVLNGLLEYWLLLFPAPTGLEKSLSELLSPGKPFGLYRDLVVVALTPAVCEEFFFRGFVQTSLNTHIKPVTAVMAAAFFFTLFHFNPWLAPFYFILGSVFGLIYLKTNNLGMSILAHFINNAYGVVMYHLSGKIL